MNAMLEKLNREFKAETGKNGFGFLMGDDFMKWEQRKYGTNYVGRWLTGDMDGQGFGGLAPALFDGQTAF